MNWLGHILVLLLYIVPAAGFSLQVLPVPGPLMPLPGIIVGALVAIGGLGAHGVIAALLFQRQGSGALRQMGNALADAAAEQRRLEADLKSLRSAILDLRDQPRENVERVVAEVKVLQSLIGQLYSARAGGGGPAAPGPAPALAKAVSDPVRAASIAGSPNIPAPVNLDPDEILELVKEGLRENGVELALQPIVSLPQRKRRHFECFSRIRARDGRIILPEQFIEIAERNGLITAIDNLLLLRCLQTLRRIRKASANVGFFLNISPYTLADRAFFREFIGLMIQNADLAPALVFELPQRALGGADANLGRDLDRLAQMGFRFSLDQVGDLDLNVAQLASAHFRFLKLDAELLLRAARDGMLGGDAKQFKRVLDSYGIDLIVKKIETEAQLLELLDLHIDYGQGYLFGEPRLAKHDPSLAAG